MRIVIHSPAILLVSVSQGPSIMRLVRRRWRMMMLGFLFLATPAVATADTIDFGSSRAFWPSGSTYFEDGYALFFESNSPPGNFFQGTSTDCSPTCADNGTTDMMSFPFLGAPQTMTLTRVGGGTFSLLSFDGAESYSQGSIVWASAIQANGSSFILDQVNDGSGGVPDFQTFAAGLINVNSVVFSGVPNPSGNTHFKIDNLVVEATAVPDQGHTWLLLLLGTGGLGLLAEMRRRKQENVRADVSR